MTCIAAVRTKDGIWMGGDSAGVSGHDLELRADPKVFRLPGMLIGYTSSFRMGQLLRFNLTLPSVPEKMDTERWLMTSFIDAVRACLGSGGYKKKANEQEEGGTFLVAYRGVLAKVESDFQVGIPAAPYTACGCGGEYARGAMSALWRQKKRPSPESMVNTALLAAQEGSGWVREPFTVLSDKPSGGAEGDGDE